MKRLLFILVALAAVLFVSGCNAITFVHAPSTSTTVCYEDQPCWDCHTMGNRICGPGRG